MADPGRQNKKRPCALFPPIRNIEPPLEYKRPPPYNPVMKAFSIPHPRTGHHARVWRARREFRA